VGAKLGLSIYYYRAPDLDGADYGAFYGRDDDGRWELHFAGPEEMQSQFDRIVRALSQVASDAREVTNQPPSDRSVWLKAIGAVGWPAKENWWTDKDRDQGVNFPYRPRSIREGDLLVVYAAGTGKVVGVLEVASGWYHEGKEERWPWRMKTRVRAARPISEGVALESLSDEREITKSIRQKSHIRLTSNEAAKALAAFGVDRA
jgi:hypothetical protein